VEKQLRAALRNRMIAGESEDELLTAAVTAGAVSAQQAETVRQANAARSEVIRVDDFPADYWRKGGEHE
jgi:acyl-CoA dehydrogenase